jgi:hypothetical protein
LRLSKWGKLRAISGLTFIGIKYNLYVRKEALRGARNMKISILAISLVCILPVGAAERASSPMPLAQAAPIAADGFPLRFPQEPAPAPLPAPVAPRIAEELPLPAVPAPLATPAKPVVPPAALPAIPVRALSHREFAATFRPFPGNYEVLLIHPYTHRPVKVCFSLPPGRIKEVDADHNELRFDYGSWELEVHFKRDGRVALDIDD